MARSGVTDAQNETRAKDEATWERVETRRRRKSALLRDRAVLPGPTRRGFRPGLHGKVGTMRADVLSLPIAATETHGSDTEPVIVLPGGPCRGPEYVSDLAGLGRTHRLIVLHPRGTPQSGGLSRGWWSDADDVIALADALDLDRVDLLAHSAGTRLALAVATRYPHRVRSLALVTPPAAWLTETRHDGDSVVLDRSSPAVAEALRSLEQDDPSTEDAFRTAFLRQAPATYAHWTESEQAHANSGAVSRASALAWFNDIPADATDRIRATNSPQALVIGGDRDYLPGIRPVVDYATALGADLAMIEDCGHYPWIEQPEAFLRITDDWLSTVRSARI
ncbi:alpha/beta hydrolase [uncultured Microbacterium sp.]|uniref:alpha/beta fold hydrolase n=1 Tax=uncultured Microbacterium sp. TaxID=191216 RepID=UPI00342DBCAC